MAKEKIQCHICGVRIKGVEAPICLNCGTDRLRPDSEQVVYAASCAYQKSFMNMAAGTLLLTNERLVWLKDSSAGAAAAVGGLVGALVATAVSGSGGKVGVAIPLSSITGLEDTRQGLRKMLMLRTREGGAYKIGPDGLDDWRALLPVYA